MIDPAIEVTDLRKNFGAVEALKGLSFSVPPGAVTGLLGGNGAGKTTTISILLGLLLPSSGAIRVLGVDMLRDRYRVLPRMNFTSPYVDLPHRLTVMENLQVAGHLYGLSRVKEKARSLARDLEVEHLLKRPLGQLSSGQKTRVALAKSLLNEPDLLLMDEPTASLDPDMADFVRGYLEAYQKRTGATMLLASHNMTEVERMCGEVIMLRAGEVVDHGPPKELIRRHGRKNMEEVFIAIARHNGEHGGAGANPPGGRRP